MWVVFWYSSYFSISTAGRVEIESKAPVPHSSASSCTHIGVRGNRGERRPCPPSFATSSGTTGHLEAGSPSSSSSTTTTSRSTSTHKYGIGLPMGNGPVPPSSASSCTHIGVGGNQGDRRPCPPSFAISSGATGHLEAGSTSSHKYGIGLPMGNGPVPPSSASSCTHIGVGGNQGDRRPCPPSFAISSGATYHLEAGSTSSPSRSPSRSTSTSSHKHGIGLPMGKAPVPPSSASSYAHIGVGGNRGDRRPCPPSSATSSGTTGHLEAGHLVCT